MLPINKLKSLNFQWEAIISTTKTEELRANNNGLSMPSSNNVSTIITRAIIGKKQGVSIETNSLKIKQSLINAQKTAQASNEIDFMPKINSQTILKKEKINYKNFNEKELAESMEKIIAKLNNKAPLMQAHISKQETEYNYINYLGANLKAKTDEIAASIEIGKNDSIGFDYFKASSKKPDFSNLVKNALLKYDYSKKTIKPKSGNYSIILCHDALMAALSPILFSLKAQNVFLKKSRFINSIEKKELSNEITITDNCNEKNNKSYFDFEGNKSKKTLLAKKGIIKSFIHDNFTSQKMNMKNTNNSSSMIAKPSASFNCIEIKGDQKMQEMIKNTKKGFLLYDLYPEHTINPTTGAFGQNSSSFYYIENGEIKGLSKGYVITGNSYEIFKKTNGVSKETRNDMDSNIGAIKTQAKIIKN